MSAARLAELLTSAAATFEAAAPSALAPTGSPVRLGRLHLGRVRQSLPPDGPVAVVAGFATACWLGSPEVRTPNLGRLAYRSVTTVDRRGRVTLDRQVRVGSNGGSNRRRKER